LVAGQKYKIVVEYFEYTGGATIKLQWSSPSQVLEVIPRTQLYPAVDPPSIGTGLRARYYQGINFNVLKVTQTDPRINFNWGIGAPLASVAADNFSVVWDGQIQPLYTESYTISTVSDDGIRVWINGQQVINNWTYHSSQVNSGTISLVAGQKYNIVVQYFEGTGSALAVLRWASARQALQVVPQTQLYPAQ
jgi:hypothetical protein